MKYLRKYNDVPSVQGDYSQRPLVAFAGKHKFGWAPSKGYNKETDYVTLEDLDDNVLVGYLKATITANAATTLPVYYTKESWSASTPDETIELVEGDNEFYFDKSIYRIDIVVYNRSTGKRISQNSAIIGIKLDGVWEDGYRMFDCVNNPSSITNMDFSQLNTSKMTTMRDMLQSCQSLTNIGNLKNWDLSNVTDMSFLFNDCEKLKYIDGLNNWNTSKISTIDTMFDLCHSLTSVGDLSNWCTSACTDMSWAFNNCNVLTSVGDLSNWCTSRVTDISCMFCFCYVLTSVGDLSNWNTSKVETMNSMFCACYALTNVGNLSSWCTSACTDMSYMFSCCDSLISIGDISKWDTSKVTTMQVMFGGSRIEELNLSNWNTSKVTNMGHLFGTVNIADDGTTYSSKIKNLGVPPIPKGCSTSYMFYACNELKNITASGTISQSVSFSNSPLTRASALVLFNALDASNVGTLTLSTSTKALLSDDDMKIATGKGWTIA